MQYDKAVNRYFNCNKRAWGVLKKLVRWEPGFTFAENCKRVGFEVYGPARNFVCRFKLRCKGSNPLKGIYKIRDVKINPARLDKIRNMGYTYEQIGKLEGVSRQRIEQIMARYRRGKGVV